MRLRELGQRAVGDMEELSATLEVPADEIEKLVSGLTEGGLDASLQRIAAYFVPRRDAIETQIRESASVAPLTALIPRGITDPDGRLLARVGSVEDDLEGHVALHISQNMQIEAMFLDLAFKRVRSKHELAVESLSEHVSRSPLFPPDQHELLEAGFGAYLREDHLAACSILVPRIEAALRRILLLAGAPIYRSNRLGGFRVRTLDDILHDEVVATGLGDDLMLYLRVLLTDQRGWNARNVICHGLAGSAFFNRALSDRVLHALLVLGSVREKPTAAVE